MIWKIILKYLMSEVSEMKKSLILGSSLLLLMCMLAGCNTDATSHESTSSVTTASSENKQKPEEIKEEKGEDEIARIEDNVIGNNAEDLGLDQGFVVSEDTNGTKQVTGISFYGVKGISQYETDDKGNITSYTLYAENIADDFEGTVEKAVKGMEKETGETAKYEEVEVNEGKQDMTTLEALKKGNLYCNYTFTDKGTYIQIVGDGAGNISMLIKIGEDVEETEINLTGEESETGDNDVEETDLSMEESSATDVTETVQE